MNDNQLELFTGYFLPDILFSRVPANGKRAVKVMVARRRFNAHLTRAEITGKRPRCRRRMTVKLTPRELEVLQYLAEGKTNGQIALKMELSESTVSRYREILREKFGGNMIYVVAVAYSMGIIKMT